MWLIEMMTVEDCIKAHAKDLKIVQKVSIFLTIFAFVVGILAGYVFWGLQC